MKSHSIKNISMIAIITVLAKCFALVRQIVLTTFFGATNISDAYILAQSIPNTMFLLVTSAIGVSFIPIYNEAQKERGNDGAEVYTSEMLNAIFLVATIIVIITELFAEKIIYVFASGFDVHTINVASSFLRITILGIYFLGFCGVFSSYLKIKEKYFAPSVIGIALSLVEIVACIIAYYSTNVILAIGVLLASIVQCLIVFLAANHVGFRYRHDFMIKDEYVKRSLLMALPVLISLGVDEINVIIDRTIASTFSQGSISSLTYANTLVTMIYYVIPVSINTILFTDVAKLAINNERKLLAKKIQTALESALFFLIPATTSIIAFSKPIIKLLFERGNFTSHATQITAGAMAFYALSIIPNGVRLLTQTYFYSYKRTRLCMIVGFIAVLINIILNVSLSKIIGINGLAFATSIAILVAAVLLFVVFLKENPTFDFISFAKKSGVMLINAISTSVFSYKLYEFLMCFINSTVALIIAICFVGLFYFLLCFFTKIIDFQKIKKIFSRRKSF